MTTADKLATDALARHLAYLDGEWWETVPKDRQAVYRARALDYVQVVGPIYQQALAALSRRLRSGHRQRPVLGNHSSGYGG